MKCCLITKLIEYNLPKVAELHKDAKLHEDAELYEANIGTEVSKKFSASNSIPAHDKVGTLYVPSNSNFGAWDYIIFKPDYSTTAGSVIPGSISFVTVHYNSPKVLKTVSKTEKSFKNSYTQQYNIQESDQRSQIEQVLDSICGGKHKSYIEEEEKTKYKYLRVKRIEKDKEVILNNVHFYYATAQPRDKIKGKIMNYANFRGVFRDNLINFGILF